jgi:flagellar basal-body rod modification protein FlgD
MNPTESVGPTTPPALYGSLAGSQTASGSIMSGNSFMQLLVSELQNQDPTSPMSASSFVSQMTSLSLMTSMQQLAQDIQTLGQIGEARSAVGLLGRTVTATLADGSSVTGMVRSVIQQAGASSPTLVVQDASGQTVDVALSSVNQVTASGTTAGTGA